MKPLISVIIPVYNVEKYIEYCVNSVLCQSYTRFEIILIDDGSTDRSPQICDAYGRKDKRIKVIHKKNGGLSDSRNRGIEESVGDYLLFLDGDDFLKDGSLDEIANLLYGHNPDVLISLLYEYYDSNNIIPEKFPLTNEQVINSNKEDLINKIFSTIEWSAPKYIVKRKLVVENNLAFKVGFLHEDVDWTTRLFLIAEDFSVYNNPFYFHRMNRKGSITNTQSSKRVNDVITIVSELITYIKKIPGYRNIFEQIASRLSKSCFYYVSIVYFFDFKQRRELIKLIKSNIYILSYSKERYHRLFYLFIKIFGIKVSLYFMFLFKKIVNKK